MLLKCHMLLTEREDILLYGTETLFGCSGLLHSSALSHQPHSISILEPYSLRRSKIFLIIL